MESKDQVFLLLGGNLGNVSQTFERAIRLIQNFGVIQTTSSVYRTSPWGMTNASDFLNQVLVLNTDLEPSAMLIRLKEIEKQLGRKIKTRDGQNAYESRELDIDILMWGNLILEGKDLTIPHPRLHQRAFTLVPLAEIDDQFIHPVFDLSVRAMLDKLEDSLSVSKI